MPVLIEFLLRTIKNIDTQRVGLRLEHVGFKVFLLRVEILPRLERHFNSASVSFLMYNSLLKRYFKFQRLLLSIACARSFALLSEARRLASGPVAR